MTINKRSRSWTQHDILTQTAYMVCIMWLFQMSNDCKMSGGHGTSNITQTAFSDYFGSFNESADMEMSSLDVQMSSLDIRMSSLESVRYLEPSLTVTDDMNIIEINTHSDEALNDKDSMDNECENNSALRIQQNNDELTCPQLCETYADNRTYQNEPQSTCQEFSFSCNNDQVSDTTINEILRSCDSIKRPLTETQNWGSVVPGGHEFQSQDEKTQITPIRVTQCEDHTHKPSAAIGSSTNCINTNTINSISVADDKPTYSEKYVNCITTDEFSHLNENNDEFDTLSDEGLNELKRQMSILQRHATTWNVDTSHETETASNQDKLEGVEYSQAVKRELRFKIELNQAVSKITSPVALSKKEEARILDPTEIARRRKSRNKQHAKNSRLKFKNTLERLRQENEELETCTVKAIKTNSDIQSSITELLIWLNRHDHQCPPSVHVTEPVKEKWT